MKRISLRIDVAEVAMRYLVENVLRTKIDVGIRDSVRLRDNATIEEKNKCCKS